MDDRQAFKFAFLSRCVENGLSFDEMTDVAEKAAQAVPAAAALAAGAAAPGLLSRGWDKLMGATGTAAPYAIGGLLAAPPLIGAAGGMGLAKLMNGSEGNVADIQDQEVIDEYRRQAARLRREKSVRDYAAARRQTGRTHW